MRSRNVRFFGAGIVLGCLMSLMACQRVPESKTLLLPVEETEQGVALEGEAGDRYAVRKIYSKEYTSLNYGGYTAFLAGAAEHQVRLAERGTEGLRVQALDYRYGFYDAGRVDLGQFIDNFSISLFWNEGTIDEQNLEQTFFSPNGRYLLYSRLDLSYSGSRLYLFDLETEEERLLLDGDELGCPEDQFMILTAWSRDASTLCYGFYPRSSEVWNSYEKSRYLLYYLDLKSGEVINQLNYSYAGVAGKATDLQSTRLYMDRSEDKILTMLVSESAYMQDEDFLDFFQQVIPRPGFETEGVVMPVETYYAKNSLYYPDAASDTVYVSPQGEVIDRIDARDGTYLTEESMQIEEFRILRDFCVLEDGGAFVTAEYNRGNGEQMIYEQDICLYTKTEEGLARRVLYQNAGCVIRLQYDPVNRRILAETGNIYEVEESINGESGIEWDENRRILVLEF